MADFEPPSFSLGFDLDADSDPETAAPEHSNGDGDSNSSFNVTAPEPEDDRDCEGLQVADSDAETGDDPPRALKRLRKGPPSRSVKKKRECSPSFCLLDDEIEEFSSQEELTKDATSTPYHSVCSSSKVPLQGILKASSSGNVESRKRKEISDLPSSSFEASNSKFVFPKLTISPLRKFLFLDSESEDPPGSVNFGGRVNNSDPPAKGQQSNPEHCKTASRKEENVLTNTATPLKDLWKDFSPIKSVRLQTPCLDEFCTEYFQSREANVSAMKVGSNSCVSSEGCHENNNICLNSQVNWDMAEPPPPSYHYFFHDDPRIQKLVRERLPNFFPLGASNNRANQQQGVSVIDYMGQFSNGEAPKGQAQKINAGNSSRKVNNKSKASNCEPKMDAFEGWVDPKTVSSSSGRGSKRQGTKKSAVEKKSRRGRHNNQNSSSEEVLHGSGGWAEPKSSLSFPRDAGKRRVQASDQSAGEWYTGSDGRKVYVAKSGQKMTGRAAYRQYKKDKGGIRKSKKKGSTNKSI